MQNTREQTAESPHEDLKAFIRSEADSLRAQLRAFGMELRSEGDRESNAFGTQFRQELRSALQAQTIKLAAVMIVAIALFVAAVKLIPNVG